MEGLSGKIGDTTRGDVKLPVVILGGGGHAKVVIDIFRSAGKYEPVCCVSKKAFDGETVSGLPIVGEDSCLPGLRSQGLRFAFIAVGSNRLRKKLMDEVLGLGFEVVSAISPHSYLASGVRVGKGVAVMPMAVVGVDSNLGDGAIINTGAVVDHDGQIGEFVHVAPGCAVAGCVTLEVGAFLGAGAKVIPGMRVGAYATVGAGGVVIRDVQPNTTVVGVPAKVRAT